MQHGEMLRKHSKLTIMHKDEIGGAVAAETAHTE